MKITEKIHNIETDEITIVERDATIEEELEIQQAKQRADEFKKLQEENQIKRTALLDKLGITEDEAKLLLG